MPKIRKNILYYGSDKFVITQKEIRAGPISLVLQDGDVRHLRIGNKELIQRIYGAVRDRNWDTIPGTYSDWKIKRSRDAFQISFLAEHRQRDIDFVWKGSINGSSGGSICYSMDGMSRSTFSKCLIGLCVHFPVTEYHGRKVQVLKRCGRRIEAAFPYFVSAIQPLPGFEDIEGIDYEPTRGLSMQLRFNGDSFEMEDQRNWTDGSYKAYSFPGSQPLPIEVRNGEKVSQQVAIIFDLRKRKRSRLGPRTKHMDTTTISIQEKGTDRLIPRVGLGSATHRESISDNQLRLLKLMNLSHLRVDLHLYEPEWRFNLSLASTQAREIRLSLEVAAFLSQNAEQELNLLRKELDELKPRVAVFLVFQRGETTTNRESIELARRILGDYQEGGKIGGGTNSNFFDLSSCLAALKGVDVISYSMNPQVHATDITSLVETFEGERWTVLSARQVIKKQELAISPITIRPRFNPDLTGPEVPADPNELPYQVDSRQMSLYGACWTAGSIKTLAEAGADSLTYYETTGWRGVMETEAGSLMRKFPSEPGMIFPLYHVITDVSEMSGGKVHRCVSTNDPMVNALTMSKNGHIRTLAYNLTPRRQKIHIKGTASRGISRIRRLNEKTALDAMFNAEEFRNRDAVVRSDRNFTLLPYEVLRIDTL